MKCVELVIDGFGILSTTTSAERKAWLFHSQDEVRQTVALRTIRFFLHTFQKNERLSNTFYSVSHQGGLVALATSPDLYS